MNKEEALARARERGYCAKGEGGAERGYGQGVQDNTAQGERFSGIIQTFGRGFLCLRRGKVAADKPMGIPYGTENHHEGSVP